MRIILILFLVLSNNISIAQIDTLHIHYHKNGEVSTINIIKDNQSGKARAYNQKKELIYEKDIRQFAGNASVEFTHYENGSVKTANYSSHPDGGIQWEKIETTFSENGEIIKEYDHNRYVTDPNKPLYLEKIKLDVPPTETPRKQPNPKKPDTIKKKDKKQNQEIMECASIHENKVQIVNHSRFKIELTLIHQNKDSVYVLRPGEKVDGPSYVSADVSRPIQEVMNFRYSAKRKRKNVIHITTSKKENQNKTLHTINLFESKVERE